jgi:hypothetical protein
MRTADRSRALIALSGAFIAAGREHVGGDEIPLVRAKLEKFRAADLLIVNGRAPA